MTPCRDPMPWQHSQGCLACVSVYIERFPKKILKRANKVGGGSLTHGNTTTVQTRTDPTVRRSAVAALGESSPSNGTVSRGPYCKAAQSAEQLSDFSTTRDESVRKFPKRKHGARKVSRVKRVHIALAHP